MFLPLLIFTVFLSLSFVVAIVPPGEREAEGGKGRAYRAREVLPPLHGVGVQAGDALQLGARDTEDEPRQRGAAAQGTCAWVYSVC